MVDCFRPIREFVLGAIATPSLMCFFWFTLLGGTAIDLELSGVADGAIYAQSLTAQLYATINVMLSSGGATIMSILIVILLLTYLVTSADSAVLVVNTINAGGEYGSAGKAHIIIWGLILTS
jgi:choline/glycine/proline betaine transport protein